MNAPFLAFLGTTELIIILVIVVVIFGAGKLTDIGKQLGSGIREFKSEMNREGEESQARLDEEKARTMESEPRDVTDEHKSRS